MNMESLSELYLSLPHTRTRDLREPLWTFEFNGQVLGLHMMDIAGWIEIVGLLALESLLVVILSTVVYTFVVKNQGRPMAYLASYGLVIPLVFVGPFSVLSTLQIRNQIFRFCFGAIHPVTCLFKTTAAAHGFTPEYAKKSIPSFALYFSVPLPLEWNPKLDKYTPSTFSDVLGHLRGYVVLLLIASGLQSLFLTFPQIMPPMATGYESSDSDMFHLTSLLDPRKWVVRNLLFGIYFQIMIATFGEGLIAAQALLTGCKVLPVMDNPMGTSRSISQLWGSKWNLVVHDGLKRGVYLPVRRRFPKHIAMLSTFVASGLFHELLLVMAIYPFDDAEGCFSDAIAAQTKVDCYRPPFFITTLFFLWQALLIAVEYSPVGKLKLWSRVPDVLVTPCVVLVGAIPGHYFSAPYWNSLVFENAGSLFFVIKPVSS